MMNRYRRPPRATPAGVATASVLLVTIVMALSVVFDRQPVQVAAGTSVVEAASTANG